MDIQAAVAYSGVKPFQLETVRLEEPRADEVLVRIAGVGICHTDLVMKSAIVPFPFPAVFGHEGAGIVEAVGDAVNTFAVGDHVVMSFLSCGTCRQCENKSPAYCESLMPLNYVGTRPDGSATISNSAGPLGSHFFCQSSFATHALARARNLVKVDKDLPLEILGPFGCGIQTGAGAVLRSLDMPAGSSLLITGAGAVGLSAVMAAAIRRCRHIIVVEPAANRRELALKLGATHALAPSETEQQIGEVLGIAAKGVDAALDTSGNSGALEACLGSLATRGVLGVVGAAAADMPLPGHVNGLLSRGLSIRGIIEGDSDPGVFIPELLQYYRDGVFPFEKMVKTYPFAAINEAMADHESGKTVKAVLTMP